MDNRKVVLVQVFNLEHDSVYFYAPHLSMSPGERCVVDHEGLRLGVVRKALTAGEQIGEHLEKIVRKATHDDLHKFSRNLEDSDNVLADTRKIIARHDLPMHLVAAEYTLDRTKLQIYFTAPHRVDFRDLLRELASTFKIRIELRQMGTRDEASMKGGIGHCGRVVCCYQHLDEPKPVPMELAYDQELFVAPERITGLCGRLMCCLHYECEFYREELAKMPKLGTKVEFKKKRGKIVSHNIFSRTAIILTADKERIEAKMGEIQVLSQQNDDE